MSGRLIEIFDDENLVEKIKKRMPRMFHLAELESSRAGKIGMQVGSLREGIIIALLIYKFGEASVETEIPITEPEIDVRLFGQAISIKTTTGRRFGGVKLIWTVDPQKAYEFFENYSPCCDILLAQINWNNVGGLYYIPSEAQIKLLERIGRDKYIKLPKQGTNPRGVEITQEALSSLVEDEASRTIKILWQRENMDYNPYKRWVDHWRKD